MGTYVQYTQLHTMDYYYTHLNTEWSCSFDRQRLNSVIVGSQIAFSRTHTATRDSEVAPNNTIICVKVSL